MITIYPAIKLFRECGFGVTQLEGHDSGNLEEFGGERLDVLDGDVDVAVGDFLLGIDRGDGHAGTFLVGEIKDLDSNALASSVATDIGGGDAGVGEIDLGHVILVV